MRKEALDSIINEKCLLKHPFYRAWNVGALTVQNIGLYATQYGEFIDTIAHGWEAAGDLEVAAEEREHAALWTEFANGLGVSRPAQSRLPEIEALVGTASEQFSSRAGALGALYAFEQQQPATAATKLEGLRKYYSLSPRAEIYFDIHKADFDEPAWLAGEIEKLSPAEYVMSEAACRAMASALWTGLDGVMHAIES